MNETNKQLVPVQKNTLAVIKKQLDITDRLLKERALALTPDVFNVPADGTFEEAVQRVRPDGLILIAAGRYVLEAGVKITKPLRIKGAGRDLTIIESFVEESIISVETGGAFHIEDVTIQRKSMHDVNGTNFSTDLCTPYEHIILISVDNFFVKSCCVEGSGLIFDDVDETINDISGICVSGSSNGIIKNAIVTECAVGIFVKDNTEIALIDSLCEKNSNAGLLFVDSSSGIVEKNIFRMNGGYIDANCNYGSGVSVSGHSTATLIDNRFDYNGASGISFRNSATGFVKNNTSENNSGAGLLFEDSSSGMVEKNIFRMNGNDGCYGEGPRYGGGVSVSGRSNVTLIDNRCEDNCDFGICYRNTATGSVKNNICDRNTNGIDVGNESEVNLSGTQTQIYEDKELFLIGNRCEENDACGIAFIGNDPDDGGENKVTTHYSSGVVENNICRLNGLDGIRVQRYANPSLISNRCEENKNHGILFMDDAAGTAEKNICNRNIRSGIAVSAQGKVELIDNQCEENGMGDHQEDQFPIRDPFG